jgi:hypothetical protein
MYAYFTPRSQLIVLLLLATLSLTGCGQAASTGSAVTPEPATSGTLSPIVAASELVVGQNRLPLGVVKNGTPLNDPNLKVHVRFFKLGDDSTATAQGEADALYRGQGLPAGLYVAYPTLDQPGPWGLEVQMTEANGTTHTSRIRVEVLPQASTPTVGSPAIPSKNLTAGNVPDLKQLTSDTTPDPDLYQTTIADALAAQKPFLVAFSTPGFCKTAVCAPNLEVIKTLQAQFTGQLAFIHVEVYPYPFGESVQKVQFVPAMQEWNLRTEPWTFLVDGQGVIQAKYEGGITFAELEPALQQLAAGQPVQPAQQ